MQGTDVVEIAVLVALFVTGLGYNKFVEYVQAQLPNRHGVTAFLVVGGVMITLTGFLILAGLSNYLLALKCFIASGVPMIVGSVKRFNKEADRRG